MNQLINTVNQFMAKSADPIRDQQIAYIPRLVNDQIDYIINYYTLEGKRVPMNPSKQIFIKLKYLRFVSMNPRKYMKYNSGVFNMQNLVDNNIILPFMVFINGYFVPWEFINIVIDNDNYHLIVNGNTSAHYASLCRKCNYVQIIALPEYISCVKDCETNPYNTLFSFNERGEFDVDNIKYAFECNSSKDHLGFNYWRTNTAVNAYPLLNQTDIKISEDNVILFVNGLLKTGEVNQIARAIDDDAKAEDGSIHPCLKFDYFDELPEQPNPEITVESCLLTINGGKNENADVYDFGLFVNPEYTESADNISRVNISALSQVIADRNNSGVSPEYLDKLLEPFNITMDRNKKYSENIAQAIKTIMSYNTDLFNSTILQQSNLVVEEHTGEWVFSNMLDDGTITLSIAHDTMIDEFIIVLVNGQIYRYFDMCKYDTNKFRIPIANISTEDTIQFLRFQNVNNAEYVITINEGEFRNYTHFQINEDMALFSTEYPDAAYEYPENGLQHFEVGYTLEKSDDGKIKIVLDNPYYYGKPLVLAYKNRFKHFHFKNRSHNYKYDEFVLDMGSTFKYCPDYSRYLVFVNGRRLLSSHYRLVLPVRPTTPFSEFKIYLTMPITIGDRLDVFYTSSLMQDIVVADTLDVSGDIVVDKSILDYGFNTDLFTIWVNGRKVPESHITNIDSTRLRITTDEESTNSLCVTKNIPSIEILDKLFDENTALWDSITSIMSEEEINKLLGIQSVTMTNTEANFYEDTAGIKAIMHELIRDQFLANPRVDVTGSFVYDYMDVDTSIVTGKDDGGNNVLSTADANVEENLTTIDRQYP